MWGTHFSWEGESFRLRFSLQLPRLLIVCTALLAIGTLVVRGNSCGHDFDFHLLSWMEVARAWHTGLLYPHWVQEANYGAGEPRLIFYPPASWLLGGLLGVITGWHAAPVLFVLLALLGAGGSMYLLAREWAPPDAAAFAACLYIANPYALFVAYERSALGELLAGAWLPLMVLFALRKRSSIALLGLSVAALWLTNSPAAVIGSYMLAVLALGMWIAETQPWPALRAAGGMVLGLGLAAFYIVPAAFEQRWVQIEKAIMPGMRVEDSFLFAHTADAFHDQVLRTASWIFIAELGLVSIAAWLAWRRRTGGKATVALTSLIPIILLLQLPLSDVIWKHAPHLKFLQFPWRWTLALSVVGCVLAALAVGGIRGFPRLGWKVIAGVLIAATAAGGGWLFFQLCDDEDAVAPQIAAFAQGPGIQGTDEYTPAGADNTSVQQNLPLVRVLRRAQDDDTDGAGGDNPQWRSGGNGAITATVDAKRQNAEHWVVSVSTPEPGFAVLRLMEYPAWRVTVDGRPAQGRPAREDGLMVVPVTVGIHSVEVRWMATRDVIAGRAVSGIALLLLATVAMLERRKGRV